MTEQGMGEPCGLERPLQLLQQLQELTRQQATTYQTLRTDHERLQRAVEEAVTRMTAMVSGARASRAELQAIIDTLRAAQAGIAAGPDGDPGPTSPSTEAPPKP